LHAVDWIRGSHQLRLLPHNVRLRFLFRDDLQVKQVQKKEIISQSLETSIILMSNKL